jgi:dihydropteroate synthase
MGILNVTPDSFFDGGAWREAGAAVAHALKMVEQGADVIDVGGVSTRPGATPVPPEEELARVLPVIEGLRARSAVPISIDTTSARVAAAALDAGADIVNDVSAATESAGMAALAAERGCGLVLMHRRAAPQREAYSDRYREPPAYGDVAAEVQAFLDERAAAALEAGVARDAIVVDPGLGFGKSVEQNYRLIRALGGTTPGGFPILSAASRKSFIGAAAGGPPPAERLPGSLAVTVAQRLAGVMIFRVHDVAAQRQALAVAEAVMGPG